MVKTIFIIISIVLSITVIIFDIIQQGKYKKVEEENKRLKEELRELREKNLG